MCRYNRASENVFEAKLMAYRSGGFSFDFKDEEIVFYYTNFIKSLTQKFEYFPFPIFYNKVGLLEITGLSDIYIHHRLLQSFGYASSNDGLQCDILATQELSYKRKRSYSAKD